MSAIIPTDPWSYNLLLLVFVGLTVAESTPLYMTVNYIKNTLNLIYSVTGGDGNTKTYHYSQVSVSLF